MAPRKSPTARPALSRDRVLGAAVELADRSGLDALTMRRLGAELGVEAMSLYKHVANKGQILDGIVELIVSAIQVPPTATAWMDAMRLRATSARGVLTRHPWAIGLMESRAVVTPATRSYLDSMLGILFEQGFTIEHAAHSLWVLDSYVYGHVIQETSLTGGNPARSEEHRSNDDEIDDSVDSVDSVDSEDTTARYPHLARLEHHAQHSSFSVDREFHYGLELILTALQRAASATYDR